VLSKIDVALLESSVHVLAEPTGCWHSRRMNREPVQGRQQQSSLTLIKTEVLCAKMIFFTSLPLIPEFILCRPFALKSFGL